MSDHRCAAQPRHRIGKRKSDDSRVQRDEGAPAILMHEADGGDASQQVHVDVPPADTRPRKVKRSGKYAALLACRPAFKKRERARLESRERELQKRDAQLTRREQNVVNIEELVVWQWRANSANAREIQRRRDEDASTNAIIIRLSAAMALYCRQEASIGTPLQTTSIAHLMLLVFPTLLAAK